MLQIYLHKKLIFLEGPALAQFWYYGSPLINIGTIIILFENTERMLINIAFQH